MSDKNNNPVSFEKSVKTLLVDGDIIANKAAFMGQTAWYVAYSHSGRPFKFSSKAQAKNFAPEQEKFEQIIETLSPSVGFTAVRNIIKGIKNKSKVKNLIIYVGTKPKDSLSFRYKVYPEYKSNRKSQPAPVHVDEIKQYILDKYPSVEVVGEEADDYLCMDQDVKGFSTAIASIDKDLWQASGWHYNLDTDIKMFSEFPGFVQLEKTASGYKKLVGSNAKWLFAQMLLGDAVDGIPSPVHGMGPVKVYKKFQELGSLESIITYVKEVYKNSDIDYDTNLQLLEMVKNKDDYPMYGNHRSYLEK